MTFKKDIISCLPKKTFTVVLRDYKAQSIIEYLILTTVIAAVVLFFANAEYFKKIYKSCDDAFKRSVEEIIK